MVVSYPPFCTSSAKNPPVKRPTMTHQSGQISLLLVLLIALVILFLKTLNMVSFSWIWVFYPIAVWIGTIVLMVITGLIYAWLESLSK